MPNTHTIALSSHTNVAVATVDITDLVSLEFRGKHRGTPAPAGRLTGRVLMLTDGRQELLLIALDLLELYEPWMDRFKKALWTYLRVPHGEHSRLVQPHPRRQQQRRHRRGPPG